MENKECCKCGQPATYDNLCDNCYKYQVVPAKHMTRNPVDINLVQANAVAHIGKAYDANQEAKRERAAVEDENRKLRSSITSLDKIIAYQNKEIDAIEALVNEMQKRSGILTFVSFLLGGLVILLCFLL